MATVPKGLLFGTAGVPFSSADDLQPGRDRAHQGPRTRLPGDRVRPGRQDGPRHGGQGPREGPRARRPPERPRALFHQPQLRRPGQAAGQPGAAPQDGPRRGRLRRGERRLPRRLLRQGHAGADVRGRQVRTQDAAVGRPERAPGDRPPDRDDGQAVAVRLARRGPGPLPRRRRAPALPRFLASLRPRGPGQLLRRVPPRPRQGGPQARPAGPEERPHPHRRHPVRGQGRDQAPQPRGDRVPLRRMAASPARPRGRRHGHLREPEPRGRRGDAQKALPGMGSNLNYFTFLGTPRVGT
ncbi:MAG: hypothetical protein MZV64_10860 [Ignavibacteriales bacterium]|nr:hypothetical protein [Ignavibacteriales bacterium]